MSLIGILLFLFVEVAVHGFEPVEDAVVTAAEGGATFSEMSWAMDIAVGRTASASTAPRIVAGVTTPGTNTANRPLPARWRTGSSASAPQRRQPWGFRDRATPRTAARPAC